MRIVGGKFTGRDLQSPSDRRVRPTAEHVRVAMMEWLAPALAGARLLDLYAGTGALGLEAMSRGAVRCDFVEFRSASLVALKANITRLKMRDRTRIFRHDALRFAAGCQPDAYDITFVDPPYESRQLDRVIDHWRELRFSRWLVAEHAAGHVLPPGGDRHELETTAVTVYRAE
ncbi:MAG: RsmD family RNA methyltransferase [Gemmatimonadaceae bacterium]|nr:RsmD family RNA methyltransferase [Gemmatimonadaceae bacterium]